MKRLIRASEDVFAMSKLTRKRADKSIVGDIGDFIYFSGCNSSHGPRIKFYGGTKETGTTQTSPSLTFDTNGPSELILQEWMNKKNCPNAYDENYLGRICKFVNTFKSLLLLVWFNHIDETDLLYYFNGDTSLQELLEDAEIYNVSSLEELDRYARENNLYQF